MSLSEAIKDGSKTSFGRVASVPFLTSALCLQTWEGIAHIRAGESVTDAVITLAMIGIALFTGSKLLSPKSATIAVATAEQANETAPKKNDDEAS